MKQEGRPSPSHSVGSRSERSSIWGPTGRRSTSASLGGRALARVQPGDVPLPMPALVESGMLVGSRNVSANLSDKAGDVDGADGDVSSVANNSRSSSATIIARPAGLTVAAAPTGARKTWPSRAVAEAPSTRKRLQDVGNTGPPSAKRASKATPKPALAKRSSTRKSATPTPLTKVGDAVGMWAWSIGRC